MCIVDEKGEVRGNVAGFSVRILQTAFCPTHLFIYFLFSKNGEKTKRKKKREILRMWICLTRRLTTSYINRAFNKFYLFIFLKKLN